MFPVTDRINGERLALLGWSRAILLQMAHPLVASGVAQHSTFSAGGPSALRRLHHTIGAMRAIAFGDARARQRAIAGIRAVHDRVHGRLAVAIGPYPAGTPYTAHDPALLLWVHATLIESLALVYARLVAPLSDDDRDSYCRDSARVAIQIGANAGDVPQSWRDLQSYLTTQFASGAIVVGADARQVAQAVLRPPGGWVVRPLLAANRTMAVGLLPHAIREQYGFEWSAGDEDRLAALERRLSWWRRHVPARVAVWPEARRRAGS